MTTIDDGFSGYAGVTETTEGRVYTVTGGDWDEVVGGRTEESPRRAHHRQHGAAAPVHPRRAAPGARARGRDRHRVPGGHRLPAHRHREEHRVPQLDPGRHLRDADGLPGAVLQRDGVLPRGREAARRHRADPAAGHPHPRAADGAAADHLAPGVAGHRRHGDRRAVGDAVRLPRARGHPRPLRADHRPADEPRVHPSRRRRAGPAGRRGARRSASSSSTCRSSSRSTTSC